MRELLAAEGARRSEAILGQNRVDQARGEVPLFEHFPKEESALRREGGGDIEEHQARVGADGGRLRVHGVHVTRPGVGVEVNGLASG